MDHVRAGLSTVMASQGQRFMQMPHRMHASTLLVTWPLRPGGGVFCSAGYWMVSGLPNSDFSVIFPSLNDPIPAYLSVQLMQGSMVSTIMLTSARSHPASAVAMPARFCDVGVRMRMRSRYFDPLPRA